MSDETDPPVPPEPERLETQVTRLDPALLLVRRKRNWSEGCFFLLWLTGWTVGCVLIFLRVIEEPIFPNILFGVPFWASWFFVFFLLIKSFFQVEEFLLDSSGANYTLRVIVAIKTQQVSLSEIEFFEDGLSMITEDDLLFFLKSLPETEEIWLAFQLNNSLAALTGKPVKTWDDLYEDEEDDEYEDEDYENEEEDLEGATDDSLTMTPAASKSSDERIYPPNDSSWQSEQRYDGESIY